MHLNNGIGTGNTAYMQEGTTLRLIDQLIPKLKGVCYAVISLLHISNTETLKSIYYAYFHSLMKYRIILWGNSTDSRKVFTLQKKTVGIMRGHKTSKFL
jgi:hypothetical protein